MYGAWGLLFPKLLLRLGKLKFLNERQRLDALHTH